jgi:hypothetical protein
MENTVEIVEDVRIFPAKSNADNEDNSRKDSYDGNSDNSDAENSTVTAQAANDTSRAEIETVVDDGKLPSALEIANNHKKTSKNNSDESSKDSKWQSILKCKDFVNDNFLSYLPIIVSNPIQSLIIFLVFMWFLAILRAFIVTFLTSNLISKEITLDRNVSLIKLKSFIENMEKQNLQEVTIKQLLKSTISTSFNELIKNYWWSLTDLYRCIVVSFIFNIGPFCYKVYENGIGPLITICTTLNIYELFKEHRKKQLLEEKNKNKCYRETVLCGWNQLERIYDKNNNNQLKSVDFSLPTEDSFELKDFIGFDPLILEKLTQNVESPHKKSIDPSFPDFAIKLDDSQDTIQVCKSLGNKLSSVSMKYAQQARLFKADPTVKEKVLFIMTCEKSNGKDLLPTEHTRVWLMFESELKWLVDNDSKPVEQKIPVTFERPNWEIRINNLLKWGKAHFQHKPSYIQGTITLPHDLWLVKYDNPQKIE